jgi:hypothetical protein
MDGMERRHLSWQRGGRPIYPDVSARYQVVLVVVTRNLADFEATGVALLNPSQEG